MIPTDLTHLILGFLPEIAFQEGTKYVVLDNKDIPDLGFLPCNIHTLQLGPFITQVLPMLPTHINTLILPRSYTQPIDHLTMLDKIVMSPVPSIHLPPQLDELVLSNIKCFAHLLVSIGNLSGHIERIIIRKHFSKNARKTLEKVKPRQSQLIYVY